MTLGDFMLGKMVAVELVLLAAIPCVVMIVTLRRQDWLAAIIAGLVAIGGFTLATMSLTGQL
jgi:hypothetical protein